MAVAIITEAGDAVCSNLVSGIGGTVRNQIGKVFSATVGLSGTFSAKFNLIALLRFLKGLNFFTGTKPGNDNFTGTKPGNDNF